jgi:hypothetical protein
MQQDINEAQKRFDEQYITSSEIMRDLKVSRVTILLARRSGKLPEPIDVQGKIFVWEREKVKDYLASWKHVLDVRRGTRA